MKNQTSAMSGSGTEIIYRAGGLSAMILVILYLIIIALYAYSGFRPSGGEEWLKYLVNHTTAWWAILGLSVLTDFLFIPVAFSLYHALKEINRIAVLTGAGFLVLFVILDLAITWPNYATLITLSNTYVVTVDVSIRRSIIAAANYASAVLSSTLLAFYIILVPAIGILIISFVMLKGNFSNATAYVGICTGILGFVSLVGPFLISALSMTVILTSLLTTAWFLLTGLRLLRLGH